MKKHDIGIKIKKLRKDKYMSQVDLAEKAKVSALTIVRLEAGTYAPRIETLGQIAEALDVAIEDLVK